MLIASGIILYLVGYVSTFIICSWQGPDENIWLFSLIWPIILLSLLLRGLDKGSKNLSEYIHFHALNYQERKRMEAYNRSFPPIEVRSEDG